jgi:hypothetical protein
MTSVPKEHFSRYFRQRLENLKQLATLRPQQKASLAASFEPEQNILASAEIDALAKYWAIYKGRRSNELGRDRMAEFLATHGDARIWSKCSHTNLLERAAPLASSQRSAVETVIRQLCPQSTTMVVQMLTWRDDPDFAMLKSDATLQKAGVPEKFLANCRYGAILCRSYRCAWVHELNSDSRFQTHEIIPWDLLGHAQGQNSPEPHYMAKNNVRRIVIPEPFIIETFEQVLDSFERSVPDACNIALE